VGAYRKFILVPSLSGTLSQDDAEEALRRGADDLMDLAEFSLRERPLALRHAREAYVETCLRLWRAIRERHGD
jgi:hypothetical protein